MLGRNAKHYSYPSGWGVKIADVVLSKLDPGAPVLWAGVTWV